MMHPRHAALLAMALTPTLAACPGDTATPAEISITIESPTAGEIVNKRRVKVTGEAINVDEIDVNGQPVSVVGDRWETHVPVVDGENTVVASAKRITSEVTFTVDASAPKLTVTNPTNAMWVPDTEGDTLMVSGTVEDVGAGLKLLQIDEVIQDVDAQGGFSYAYKLKEGVNTLKVLAEDKAGNVTEHIFGVMHGPMVDPTSAIDPGFSFVIGRTALAATSEVIRSVLTPEFVKQFVISQFMMDGVTIDEITFDPIDLKITPKTDPLNPSQGYLEFGLTITNVNIKGTFTLAGSPIELDVKLSEAKVDTTLELKADGMGGLSLEFGEANLDLPEGNLTWTVKAGDDELDSESSDLLSGIIENIARFAFSSLLSERIIERLYDPALLERKIELLGRTLGFKLEITKVSITTTGIAADTTITMPEDKFAQVPEVPGALNRARGTRDVPMTMSMLRATGDQTTLDRLMHGVWRSGLLHQELTGKDFAGVELPFELQGGALALLLDNRIANHTDTDAPASIRLRPMFPPVLDLEGDDATSLRGRLAEFHIDIMLNADTEPKKLLTLSTFLDLNVGIEVEGSLIKLALTASATADLIDEPLLDLDDAGAEELFEDLIALVPTVLSQQIVLNGEADLTWLVLKNPTLEIHGLEGDTISLGLDIEANPEGLMTD